MYPLRMFPEAVGIQPNGRENLLPYGSLAFKVFGPRNWQTEEAMATAQLVMSWVAESCERVNLASRGFGAVVFAAVDGGEITEDEAERLVRSFLTGEPVKQRGRPRRSVAKKAGFWIKTRLSKHRDVDYCRDVAYR